MPFHGMLAAVAALLGLSGCFATPAVIEAIDPTRPNADGVEEVRHAWRTETGDVVLCVSGYHAGAYTLWPAEYAITLPAAAAVGNLDVAPIVRPGLRQFRVSQNDVRTSCPSAGERQVAAAEALPVSFLQAPILQRRLADRTDAELTAILEGQSQGPAILVIGDDNINNEPDILYLPDPAAIAGIEAIEIQRVNRAVEPNPTAIAVLPLAVAADVVLMPVAAALFLFGPLFDVDLM